MDTVSEQRLSAVHPKLANLVRMMAHQLDLESIPIRVTQGLRTWEQQDALYAQGRTAPGTVVTNAPGGSSWHNFGLACDVVPFSADGSPDWNTSHPNWNRIVNLGTNLGMVSGSEWKTFKDWPHFQITGSFGVNPDDTVRAIYKEAGISQVWAASGITDDIPEAT